MYANQYRKICWYRRFFELAGIPKQAKIGVVIVVRNATRTTSTPSCPTHIVLQPLILARTAFVWKSGRLSRVFFNELSTSRRQCARATAWTRIET